MKVTINNPNNLPLYDYRNLIPIQGNLKDLNEKSYQKLKNSIKRKGFSIPFFIWIPVKNESVIVDGEDFDVVAGNTYILDGHQRLHVLTNEQAQPYDLPCLVVEAKSFKDAKEMLLVISSQYGKMTQEGLTSFSFDLDVDFMAVTNFDALFNFGVDESEDDNSKSSGKSGEDDYEMPDNVEEIETDIQVGDLFEIGEHRLVCGDCTDKQVFERLMNGEKADIVFTDPPYGYNYESNHQKKHKVLKNDDKILKFLPRCIEFSKDNVAMYVFCSWQTVYEWIGELKSYGELAFKNLIVWKKNNWSMGDLTGAYAGQHELILFAHKGRVELNGRRDMDIWEFDREPPTLHPTMKPVELCEYAIGKSSEVGDIVLDCFAGSGSTMVAGEQTGRKVYACELSPQYCHVIVDRMAKLGLGLKIVRNGIDETKKWA